VDDHDLILRADLTTGKTSTQPLPAELRRKYLGGEGINARLLWEHFLKVDPKTDPLRPDNVLIAGMGPLGGTGFGAGSKMKFTYKSPAYGIYGDTTVGGDLGTQLSWAGYAHIVITGKAEHPVYLWIDDDEVSIRDAHHLWGKNTHETEVAIKEELADQDVGIACIGQAGENLVRFASIMCRGHRAAGRGGGGCVFGSKNLKAIVARGTKGISIYDRHAFFEVIDEFLAGVDKDREFAEEISVRYGTLRLTALQNVMGFSNYRNCKGHMIPQEGISALSHEWYQNNIGVRGAACSHGCIFGCGGWYHINGDESPTAKKHAGESGAKPEFGQLNPLGVACGVMDLLEVIHLSRMCDEYGMDTWEIGMGIAFLMELWERRVINEADITEWAGEPLSLEWGNHHTVEQIIEATALQKNMLGQILQGGVYQAAKRIGELRGIEVLKYACYGKAGAAHGGSARSWVQMGLACALAPIGAHHTKGLGLAPMESAMYFDGKLDAGDMTSRSVTLKGAGHAVSEDLMAIFNSLGICFFLVNRRLHRIPLDLYARALKSVTGINLTSEEVFMAGDRAANIQKAFNSRLGLRREDDTLCERWMNEPVLEGPLEGVKAADYLESAKDEYYQWRGWDMETSLQTTEKLEELGLRDVARVLEKENAVVRTATSKL
jgi:aldehyde:ferredoxin oxidoreductase